MLIVQLFLPVIRLLTIRPNSYFLWGPFSHPSKALFLPVPPPFCPFAAQVSGLAEELQEVRKLALVLVWLLWRQRRAAATEASYLRQLMAQRFAQMAPRRLALLAS